jgi:hypothetical protein
MFLACSNQRKFDELRYDKQAKLKQNSPVDLFRVNVVNVRVHKIAVKHLTS